MGLHTVINQKVAAKILQKSNIRNKELDEKVRREIRFSKYFRVLNHDEIPGGCGDIRHRILFVEIYVWLAVLPSMLINKFNIY